MSESISVVVADDSPFICRLLTKYLESDPAIRVVREALNGQEALDAVKTLKPDVLTLDLNMPVMNGLDALRCIMAECPVAVVLISGESKEAARITGKGLSLGAVDFIFKYSPTRIISPDSLRREIIAKVRSASRVKVIRYIPSMKRREFKHEGLKAETGNRSHLSKVRHRVSNFKSPASKIVVIGASTGGPLALKSLLSSLGRNFPFPLVIVQHMPEGFTKILSEQFNRIFSFPVREARQGDALYPGTVIIAPGNRHLLILPNGTVQLSMTPAVNGHRPSVDVTMQSAAQVFGSYATGVILSGMGNDGARGLLAVSHHCGNTFAQSGETCVVDSMPASAIEKGIVERVGSPAEIGRWLLRRRGDG
ncbi:chemotaxis-specific protein-glutamate methyltransferase CheB [Desulfococcaceae bacterium HSG8]|nr:chemotaxis-specific protein-glutamate methyltransferase CheB [Desulfococcaceae bacterium HSG8]